MHIGYVDMDPIDKFIYKLEINQIKNLLLEEIKNLKIPQIKMHKIFESSNTPIVYNILKN